MKYIVEMIMDGKPVRKISHNGNVYLPVSLGKTFKLRLKNNSRDRVLAVISVDGVNVLDASDAKTDGTGYVIAPWKTIEIDGWRKNMQDVALFEVGDQSGSYATKTGRPNNVGVVGVAFYEEKKAVKIRRSPPMIPESLYEQGCGLVDDGRDYDSTKTCGPIRGGVMGQSLGGTRDFIPTATKAGTGYGDTKHSPVNKTIFEKLELSKQVVVLYYDTIEGLLAQGVPVELNRPNPFPGEPERFFCPPPPHQATERDGY